MCLFFTTLGRTGGLYERYAVLGSMASFPARLLSGLNPLWEPHSSPECTGALHVIWVWLRNTNYRLSGPRRTRLARGDACGSRWASVPLWLVPVHHFVWVTDRLRVGVTPELVFFAGKTVLFKWGTALPWGEGRWWFPCPRWGGLSVPGPSGGGGCPVPLRGGSHPCSGGWWDSGPLMPPQMS